MTTQTTGDRRLLKLADYLTTVKPSKLYMSSWFSKEKDGWVSPDNLPAGTYDPKEDQIKRVPEAINECGFAACAVGHACGIKSFRRAGLRMSKVLSSGFEPLLVTSGVSGWSAVDEFFALDGNGWGDGDCDYLFGPSAYAPNVRPSTVASRIRKFVKNRQKAK